jgi:hypothetical protein
VHVYVINFIIRLSLTLRITRGKNRVGKLHVTFLSQFLRVSTTKSKVHQTPSRNMCQPRTRAKLQRRAFRLWCARSTARLFGPPPPCALALPGTALMIGERIVVDRSVANASVPYGRLTSYGAPPCCGLSAFPQEFFFCFPLRLRSYPIQSIYSCDRNRRRRRSCNTCTCY